MKPYNKELIKKTVNMAWPAIVESFFVAFAGLVDSYMVSSLGSAAVAAVGLTTQPKFISLSTFMATGVALAALVARRRGAKRQEDANRILLTALGMIVFLALLISAVMVHFAGSIIGFCGSTPETHDDAVLYFRIITSGLIFNALLVGINSAQRGAGKTRLTMRTNVTSNTTNIILNYILINGKLGFPALGIRGAAIATVLGTVVGCGMSIFSLTDPGGFIGIPYILKNRIKPALSALGDIVGVGWSVLVEQLLMRAGFLLTAIMAARLGTAAMAAHQVGMNIMSLSFSFGDGLQGAAIALIGYSLGREDRETALEYGRTCRMVGNCISAGLALLFLLSGRAMMGAFFREPHIVDLGTMIMHIMIFVTFFQISQVVYMGSLRAAGDTRFTAAAGAFSVLGVRVGVGYLCAYVLGLGLRGIWFGILGDQMSRFLLSWLRFRAGKWTKIRI